MISDMIKKMGPDIMSVHTRTKGQFPYEDVARAARHVITNIMKMKELGGNIGSFDSRLNAYLYLRLIADKRLGFKQKKSSLENLAFEEDSTKLIEIAKKQNRMVSKFLARIQ